MCCERKEFEIFSFEGQKTWQRAKRREKKQLFERKKEAKKTKRAFKKKSEKRKERDTKRIFFQRHKCFFFFCTSRSLEKIHHFERRRTHQEDFTKTL